MKGGIDVRSEEVEPIRTRIREEEQWTVQPKIPLASRLSEAQLTIPKYL